MVGVEALGFAEMVLEAPRMAELPLAAQRTAGEHAEDLSATPDGPTLDS